MEVDVVAMNGEEEESRKLSQTLLSGKGNEQRDPGIRLTAQQRL